VVAGVIAAPASASAQTQNFGLRLEPAIAAVAPTQRSISFAVTNVGSEPVAIAVSTSDTWVVPLVQRFDLPGKSRRAIEAVVAIPEGHDSGDHETDLTFSTAPAADGTLRVSWGLASRVLINAGGTVVHGVHIFGLSAPPIADSWDAPTVSLSLANSGNVHEIVDVSPFGQVLLLRGQTRIVSLQWSQHPWLGLGTITAAGQSTRTLFLPMRAAGGLLAVLVGLYLLRRVRKEKR